MAFKSLLPDAVGHYVNAIMSPETPMQQRLRAATQKLPDGQMQISADQGRLLAILVKMCGAKRALEIGTFTGYSALTVAAALPADGHLTCLDVSAEWTAIGKPFWQEAGVADRITLKLGPALDTLATLKKDGAKFDFAFIDADKEGYDAYFEAVLTLMPPGGVMVFDNMLRHGAVTDPAMNDASTAAIKKLNLKMRDDPRVDAAFLTVGDGFHVVRKK